VSSAATLLYHPQVAESPADDPLKLSPKHQRFADVETGLLGFLHFYRRYAPYRPLQGLDAIRALRWYYGALFIHADMLFTAELRYTRFATLAVRTCSQDLNRVLPNAQQWRVAHWLI
jgi:hypothetical protein